MENLRRPVHEMALNLFSAARKIVRGESSDVDEDNLVICPFLVTAGVATVFYYGSTGKSREKIEEILGYKNIFQGSNGSKDMLMAFREAFLYLQKATRHEKTGNGGPIPFEFRLLQRLYIQENVDINQDFLTTIKKNLNVDHEFVDFNKNPVEQLQKIEKVLTNEKIPEDFDTTIPGELIDEDYSGPRLFIVNCAHFIGSWQTTFNLHDTYIGKFRTDSGRIIQCEFMTMMAKLPFVEDDSIASGVAVVELPYLNNEANLMILFPLEKPKGPAKIVKFKGLEATASQLTDQVLASLFSRKRLKNVRISIPKFNIQCMYGLRELMRNTGFSDEILKDDSDRLGMTKEKTFRICEGFHRAAFEIDEFGTFVTPAAQQHMTNIPEKEHPRKQQPSAPRPFARAAVADDSIEMILDHPFMFGIRHNRSGLYVFYGSISAPQEYHTS